MHLGLGPVNTQRGTTNICPWVIFVLQKCALPFCLSVFPACVQKFGVRERIQINRASISCT